jgi:hypothetical protein
MMMVKDEANALPDPQTLLLDQRVAAIGGGSGGEGGGGGGGEPVSEIINTVETVVVEEELHSDPGVNRAGSGGSGGSKDSIRLNSVDKRR